MPPGPAINGESELADDFREHRTRITCNGFGSDLHARPHEIAAVDDLQALAFESLDGLLEFEAGISFRRLCLQTRGRAQEHQGDQGQLPVQQPVGVDRSHRLRPWFHDLGPCAYL